MVPPETVDWSDNNASISDHFRVHEATFLPSWRVYHIPSPEERQEIWHLANNVMDPIRKMLGVPIIVHCWIRPLVANCPDSERHGQNYNAFIGSTSTRSGHIFGQAVDWHAAGHAGVAACARVRERLLPRLEEWKCRMEDIQGGWIHIDTKPTGRARFFKP